MCAHGAASAQRTGRGRSEGGGVGADQAGRAARLRSLGRAVLVGAVVLATSCGGGTASWAAEEDAMQPQFYLQQVQDAMPLKTMRGVWRYKEQREGQTCAGRLVFEGKLDEPNRGDVLFENLDGGSCYAPIPSAEGKTRAIKGKWLMKPAKFERKGDIGTIQFNARWKLRTAQGTYIFRGDISADPIKGSGAVPDASIRGEILKEKGSENYKKVGSFQGDLREFLSSGDDEEENAVDAELDTDAEERS
eukprot:Tamp_20865.p1 GENE.Tamp_20865~~Tamp_20865.p1  ORF type:complete len:273 (-),score=44.31 Tamp_20865:356-1099(-)